MCIKKIVLLLLIVAVAPPLLAQGSTLSLDEAVQEVLSANPDIQAARYQTAAAKARVPQAKALDDPMVGVMFEDVPISTTDVNRGEEINYRIEQKIPFPGKRYVRGRAARFDAQAVSEESRGEIHDVLLDLKRTYYTLWRLDRQQGVNHENQDILRQFLGSAEIRYATGQTTADTPLKAQVELSRLKNEEIRIQQERVTHEAHLKAILNRPGHEPISLPAEIRWPQLRQGLTEVASLAEEGRPELAALGAMTRREKSKLTAARQNLIPDLSLGFEYNQRPGMEDAWTGTAMINLPVFFWKNRGEIREAKAMLKASQAEQESMKIHTQHEIEQAYSAVQAAQKLVASFRKEILPQVRATLETARTAYAAGKIDFMTLIDAARTYKDLQTSFYDNQAMVGITFAELERLAGQDLGVNFYD